MAGRNGMQQGGIGALSYGPGGVGSAGPRPNPYGAPRPHPYNTTPRPNPYVNPVQPPVFQPPVISDDTGFGPYDPNLVGPVLDRPIFNPYAVVGNDVLPGYGRPRKNPFGSRPYPGNRGRNKFPEEGPIVTAPPVGPEIPPYVGIPPGEEGIPVGYAFGGATDRAPELAAYLRGRGYGGGKGGGKGGPVSTTVERLPGGKGGGRPDMAAFPTAFGRLAMTNSDLGSSGEDQVLMQRNFDPTPINGLYSSFGELGPVKRSMPRQAMSRPSMPAAQAVSAPEATEPTRQAISNMIMNMYGGR